MLRDRSEEFSSNENTTLTESKKAETNNKEREVSTYMEYAKNRLKRLYKIDELGTAEGVVLRNIIEDLIPRYNDEKKSVEQGEASPMHLFEIEEEAVAQWLVQEYGVYENKIPKCYVVENITNGEIFEFKEKKESEKKEKELEAEGYDAFCYSAIPKNFIEDLHKMRAEKNIN